MRNNSLKYRRIEPAMRQQFQAEWNRPVRWPLYATGVLLLIIVLPAVIGYRQQQHRSAYGDGR